MHTRPTLDCPDTPVPDRERDTPSHPRYDGYKDSGMEWLGAIPEHWEVVSLKYMARLIYNKLDEKPDDLAYLGMEHIESGTGHLLKKEPVDEVSSTVCHYREGDVLFGKLRPYLAKVYHAEQEGVGTTEWIPLRAQESIFGDYLAYQLLSPSFIDHVNSLTYGVKMPRVSPDQLGAQSVVVPPLPEQRAIAAYLDRETERIDTLVAKKERLIELLEEKRTALIGHAVTKGLDNDAEMRDSGVEWIGAMPAGWETAKLKYVCTQVKDGLHHTPSKVQSNEGIPFISTQHVRDRKIDIENATYISEEDYEAGHPSVAPEPGDVLITLVGSIGFAAILPQEMYPISATRHVGYVRPGNKLLAEYLCHYTESESFERFLGLETSQVAQPSIYLTSLANHIIPLPPVEEQRRIVKRLDTQLSQFEVLIQRVRDGIARLKEYRTALISAAVTGQIDVRGMA